MRSTFPTVDAFMIDKSPKKVIEDLGDGLIMRSAQHEDAEALADFCARVFVDEESGTEAYWIAEWIRDLLGKPHPTLDVEDIIIVEDVEKGCIASTTTYLTQTWSYDGIEFEIGRPEIVGTDSAYRNRGLIRKQFEVMHRWASERGHDVQLVLGIPSYYRQFGYEYALPAEGGRYTPASSLPRWGDEERKFRLRDAVEEDVPFITGLLNDSAKLSMVSPVFREDEVKYLTFDRTPRSAVCHKTGILCKSNGEDFGQPVGALMYTMVIEIDLGIMLRLEMSEPRYWREGLPSLLKEFAEMADKASKEARDPEREIKSIRQDMQPDHPVYVFDDGALGPAPESQYGWYVRVPDIPGFLNRIKPVLEGRVADSIHAGFSGEINIRIDREGIKISMQDGRIKSIETVPPMSHGDANARFPGMSFLPVLFGMRSISETVSAHTDANVGSKMYRHLLETMFPKRSSDLSLTLT